MSVDPKRRKTKDLYTKERKESPMPTGRAGARSRASVPRLGLLLSMGAGEAEGGRRGWWGRRDWWGQARSMGAASHRPHARVHQHRRLRKPPGQTPSQHLHQHQCRDANFSVLVYLSMALFFLATSYVRLANMTWIADCGSHDQIRSNNGAVHTDVNKARYGACKEMWV